ncbi:MAG: hypothetical protein K9K66_02065 [Desulfarculaceae bacterium]|nr:hypothetical protein [Desulfarculaceae bacterium]MCF8073433.1 hypothetical protein [Desulfarculaceae bacterium]MCF8100420.1 hypothetical protein [Desulfarculaceae bacterium]MCF8115844.1 hypothetical protein [Desulfarculaceae bacterium]
MEPVQVIRPDLVLVDWGPMTLSISVWADGRPRPVMAAQAARAALRCLAVLADFQGYMRRRVRQLPAGRPLPSVVARAAEACRAVDKNLTPLAAVAGAVADQVADAALALGADKVVVNNGGDVAIRLAPGQSLGVGLRPGAAQDEEPAPLLGRLHLEASDGVGGVASSGWHGRSLSSGVADLATAWSSSAALADAAATALGNAAQASGAANTVPARKLDPASGLGSQAITDSVNRLGPAQRATALNSARLSARALHDRQLISGCVVMVQGDTLLLDRGRCLEWQEAPPTGRLLAA